MNRVYSDDQVAFMRENYPGTSLSEFTRMFNERYGLNKPIPAISSALYTRGIKNGCSGVFTKGIRRSPETEFKKGQISHNKGKKMWWDPGRSVETRFKKGQKVHNHKPVGTESLRSDGYTWVKIEDPKTWKEKHRIAWEAVHGPIPKGYAVIFLDTNKQNCEIENLALISRGQLAVMNQKSLFSTDPNLTKAGINIAALLLKVTERLTPQERRKYYKKPKLQGI